MAATKSSSKTVRGYFLVNGGAKGAGVVLATGPRSGTANSVYLGG